MTTTIAELERWLNAPREDEHLEFKEAKLSFEFQKALDYCVALSNEGGGKLVLGVTNALPRRVVGSAAIPDVQHAREQAWQNLRRRVDVEEIAHPDGRVVVFHALPRPIGEPLHRDGRYLMRAGEQLVPMSFDRIQQIAAEAEPDFTAGAVHGVEIDALDRVAVDNFRDVWATRAGNPAIRGLSVEQLLADAGLSKGGILTRAALILLGSESALREHLSAAEVIFEYRSADGSLPYQQRIEFRCGFFAWYEELRDRINLRNDRQMVLSGLFRVEIPTFDEDVVREALDRVRQRRRQDVGHRHNQRIAGRETFKSVEVGEMVNHQHDQHAAVDLAVMLKLVGISELKAAAIGQLRQRIGQRLAPQCFSALAFVGKNMLQAGRQGIHGIDHDMQQGGNILTGQTRRACIPDAQGMVYDFLQRSPQAAGRERPPQRSATRCNQQCRQRRMTG